MTRMPLPARSVPSVRVRLCTAALVAAYTGATARPRYRVQEALITIAPPLQLPADLIAFYERFAEASLFGEEGEEPRCRILSPEEFVQVGKAIMGVPITDGPERSWYALADVQDGNYLGIDLAPEHLGRCYDCFHETYGEPGYCTVIALSLMKGCSYRHTSS